MGLFILELTGVGPTRVGHLLTLRQMLPTYPISAWTTALYFLASPEQLLEEQIDPLGLKKMWLSHHGFPFIVEKLSPLLLSLPLLGTKRYLGTFLFVKSRLNGAQKAIASRPLASLITLEKDLSLEYTTILNQEEDFWARKSHLNWQLQDDKNTTFFHMKTFNRRKANRIDRLKNRVGDWLDSFFFLMGNT